MKSVIKEIKNLGLEVKGFEQVETCEDELVLTIDKDDSDVFFRYVPLDYRLYFVSKNEEFEGDYIRCADEKHLIELLRENFFMFDEDVAISPFFSKRVKIDINDASIYD